MSTFPDADFEEVGLETTKEVFESKERGYSLLLDKDGNRIPYQSKKLGYIGFTQLKER